MKPVSIIKKCLALFALLLTLSTNIAFADTPAEAVVRSFYNQLESSMRQASQLGFSGRYKKLEPAVRTSFNMPLMTKLSVGSTWSSASQTEQQQLVTAFTDFTIASYASQFAGDEGVNFSITGEKSSEGGVIVETHLAPKNGDPIALNYLMRKDDKGDYRIVDVYLNGTISQLAARRAEFSSIARDDGISALVTSLEEKSRQMGAS